MENELKQHVSKAYRIAKEDGKGFWHKAGEIGIEIFIIVFAVLFSIWLHDLSEKNHTKKEVKEFLVGLKDDLQNDIREMESDKNTFQITTRAFKYITSGVTPLDKDSLRNFNNYIFNTTGLVPNNGRYEGFKSSGKLGNINNTGLQNDITDLYQENIPSLLISTDLYTRKKEVLFTYVYKNLIRTGNSSNLAEILLDHEPQNISLILSYTNEIQQRYDSVISKSRKIINEINQKYKLDSGSQTLRSGQASPE